jgi:hypothetical protein
MDYNKSEGKKRALKKRRESGRDTATAHSHLLSANNTSQATVALTALL